MSVAIADSGTLQRRRSMRGRLMLGGLAALLVASALVAIGAGAIAIAPGKVLAIVAAVPFGDGGLSGGMEEIVVRTLRLPRMLLVALCGAAIGTSGVLMQGLFRNPLADPGLIGVSAGAALAASVIIVVGDRLFGASGLSFAALPVGAFVGAMLTTGLIYRIATRGGATSVAMLLLAGIAIGAIATAGTGFLVFLADDKQLRDMTFWMLGSFSGASWSKLAVVGPVLFGVLVAAPFLARALDALALGEAEAWYLGIAVQRTKFIAIVLAAVSVGASVAVAGVISFAGIVVPHVARLLVGPRHGLLLPASALLGAILLLAADTAARILAAPAELPLGVLMAAIGAPVFLHLLLLQQRRAP